MTTTVNATLPQDDTYVKMVEYATNLKLTDKQLVGWEKPVAVPTFTSFHLINVIYLNHLF